MAEVKDTNIIFRLSKSKKLEYQSVVGNITSDIEKHIDDVIYAHKIENGIITNNVQVVAINANE